jgi:hypothetical protein
MARHSFIFESEGRPMPEPISRRVLVSRAAQLSGLGVVLGACGEGGNKVVCAGPNNLTMSENSLRKASNYAEEAPDPAKNCTGCGFFQADPANATCGKCEIFIGPVNARGHCDSWAAKPA